MGQLTHCWSPCYVFNNVRDGSYACAYYTFIASVLMITYTSYVMMGGDSSQLYLPFFETDLHASNLNGGGGFAIVYFVLMAIFSIMLAFGVKTDIRGLFLPWMFGIGYVILFQAIWGLWLIFGYYIYLEVVFAALVTWLWMGINYYVFKVVKSHYDNVKYMQSPDIEYVDQY